MKKFAQILILALLLLGAGKAWAIVIINPNGTTVNSAVGPRDLQNYNLQQIIASIDVATGKDRTVLLTERFVREGGGTASERENLREIYIAAYYGEDDGSGITWGIDANGNLTKTGSGVTGVYFNPENRTFPEGPRIVPSPRPEGDTGKKVLPNCGLDPFCAIVKAVAMLLQEVFVPFFSFLARVANQVFNLAIGISVLNFNKLAESPGVESAWKICRDLVNISFIFVLLYVAIGTILQLSSVNGKHLLKNVIIAALLVNFSMFFTGIIIDASNVTANALYNLAAKEPGSGKTQTEWGAPDIITQLIKLADTGVDRNLDGEWSGFLSGRPAPAPGSTALQWWNYVTGAQENGTTILFEVIGSAIGTIILMVVTVTVLLAGAIMFFIRSIVLVFVIATSPVAFLGMAIGGDALGKIASKWKNALTNQVIFAPAYILLILMTIKVAQAGSFQSLAAGGGLAGGLAVFAMINGLMIGSLVVAKELGMVGAGAAMGVLGKMRGAVTGAIGRNIVGRPAQYLNTKLEHAKERAQESSAGRWGLRALGAGTLGLSAGVKSAIETGAKAKFGGAKSRQDVIAEAEAGVQARRGKPEAQANYMMGLSYEEKERAYNKLSAKDRAAVDAHLDPRIKSRLRAQLTAEDREKVEKADEDVTQQENFTELEKKLKEPSSPARDSEIKTILAKVSDKQMENMEFGDLLQVVDELKSSQLKAVMSRKDLTPDQKKQIGKKRSDGFLAKTASDIADEMGKMKPEEVAKLGNDALKDPKVTPNLRVRDLIKMLDEVDNATATAIRHAIENAATSPGGTPTDHEKASAEWFNTDPVGKHFGK